MSELKEQETQETDATSLAESPELTAGSAPAEEAAEVEEAAGTTEAAAVDDSAGPDPAEAEAQTPPPSKLEKAYGRVKDENRQLKAEVRTLKDRIAEFEAAELDREVNELARRYSLTRDQAAILKRLEPGERETIAKQMKPEGFRPFGSVLHNYREPEPRPRTRTVDSIPTLPMRPASYRKKLKRT